MVKKYRFFYGVVLLILLGKQRHPSKTASTLFIKRIGWNRGKVERAGEEES